MAHTSGTFTTLYRKLNPAQKKAVDTIEGPVMVIAGPGTGKTQVLTLRIANILRKTDTPPSAILALTFTESGVFSMRKRLVEIIGSAAYRVHIYTFHSFCNDIIHRYPERFERVIGATHISDIDRVMLLEDIIKSLRLPLLKPFGSPFFYLHPIRGALSELKRENISPKDALTIAGKQREDLEKTPDLHYTHGPYKGQIRGKYRLLSKKLEKNAELARLYERYEKELSKRRLYDYEDMILEVIKALEKDNDLLLSLQEEYQYLLADEHQDANNSQNRLLELLSSFHASPNLFLVGDEKQAIYRFQGASLLNFRYFLTRYPKAEVLALLDNYRSRQFILDSSYSLIKKGLLQSSLHAPLIARAHKSRGEKIRLYPFSSPQHEYLFIARDVKRLIDEGVRPEEVAIFYRNNRDVNAYIRVFEKLGIPYAVESDQSVLEDNDVQKFLKLLYVVATLGDDVALIRALHADFLGFDPLDIYMLSSRAAKERVPMYTLLRTSEDEHAKEFYKKLASWRALSEFKSPLEAMEIIARESGFLSWLLQSPKQTELLEKFNGLMGSVRELLEGHRDYLLSNVMRYFALLEAHSILVKKDTRRAPKSRVRLMTAHKAKGLEFDYVYITGAYDTHWGNQRTREHFSLVPGGADTLDDERRLFYVALTRARHGVSISYAKGGEGGSARLPSQFIEEIEPQYLETVSTAPLEDEKEGVLLMARPPVHPPGLTDKAFLNELFLSQSFSVTALNNYLKSPWEYFFSNLLRVPKAMNKHMLYGTAMHGALKDFFDARSHERNSTKNDLLSYFKHRLEREPFTSHDFKEAQRKGSNALSGYYDTYRKTWTFPSKHEYVARAVFPINDGKAIELRGVLDKIEFLNESGEVCVVDYKTGKPQSRNVIEGKTKGSAGDYRRQLVFYKLLLELSGEKKGKDRLAMSYGDVDFLEPDLKGRYHRERFTIAQKEVEELKATIKKVAQEILDLSFWKSECDPSVCDYCDLATELQSR